MKSNNLDWIKRRKELLKNIDSFKPTSDRVKTTTQMVYMHNAIHESMMGWANWLNGWLGVELNKNIKVENEDVVSLTSRELKELHEQMRGFAKQFIEYDIGMTELVNKKLSRVEKVSTEESKNRLRDMVV